MFDIIARDIARLIQASPCQRLLNPDTQPHQIERILETTHRGWAIFMIDDAAITLDLSFKFMPATNDGPPTYQGTAKMRWSSGGIPGDRALEYAQAFQQIATLAATLMNLSWPKTGR